MSKSFDVQRIVLVITSACLRSQYYNTREEVQRLLSLLGKLA